MLLGVVHHLQNDAALAGHANAARSYRLLKFSSGLSGIQALTGRDPVRWSGCHAINPQQTSLTVCGVMGEPSRALGNGRWLPNHDNFWIADNPGATDIIRAKCSSQRLTLGPHSCPCFTWTEVFSYSLMIGKFVVLCAI
jgi:hypothetical protein